MASFTHACVVHAPPSVRGRRGHAELARVERGDGLLDGARVLGVREEGAIGGGGFDERAQRRLAFVLRSHGCAA